MNDSVKLIKSLPAALVIQIMLASAAFAVTPAENRASSKAWPDVASILKKRIDVDKRAKSIVVGVVDANGEKTFGYGSCCADSRQTGDKDTLFEIGSITKSFTAILLADMVKRGEVKLDDPVVKYLPESMRPQSSIGREITLRQLATHTSGLPRMPDNFTNETDYSDADMGRFLANYKPEQRPSGEKQYSNLGYALLGYALAYRAKKPYVELIDRRVLTPLGMNNSGFWTQDPGSVSLAVGHSENLEPVPPARLNAMNPAGGLRSTVGDMQIFLSANLGFKKTKLASTLKYAQELQPYNADDTYRRGLAFGYETVRGTNIYLHDGSTGGFYSFLAFDPANKRGVVALSNSRFTVTDLAIHVLIPEYPITTRKNPIELPETVLRSFEGEYLAGDGRKWAFFAFGKRIMMYRPQRPAQELFAESSAKLFIPDTSISYQFEGFEKQAAQRLVVTNPDGAINTAKRVASASEGVRRPIYLSADELRKYVGRFAIDGANAFDVTEVNGRLFARLTGQDALEIFPSSRSRFFYIVVDAEIEFKSDAAGNVTDLVLHQGGQSTPAKRV